MAINLNERIDIRAYRRLDGYYVIPKSIGQRFEGHDEDDPTLVDPAYEAEAYWVGRHRDTGEYLASLSYVPLPEYDEVFPTHYGRCVRPLP